jgi:urate oxidase
MNFVNRRVLGACAASAGVGFTAACNGERFQLTQHNHGKSGVRVMKVRHTKEGSTTRHSVSQYTVETTLYSPDTYKKVYTAGDNTDLVATDTQKNTVYVVAKKCACDSPEQFALALSEHFIHSYPMLTRCDVTVKENLWERSVEESGKEHAHSFIRRAPEYSLATVELERGQPAKVISAIKELEVLKTTQSGFEGFLRDKHTSLPECTERCLSTKLNAQWEYSNADTHIDFGAIRAKVRQDILSGLFGPADTGVYSPSLQNTIYDAGCLVLSNSPAVHSIFIDTPNVHFLPCTALSNFGLKFENDVFIPTEAPSGTISCTVARDASRKGGEHHVRSRA